MKRTTRFIALIFFIFLSAVAYHSVTEIHYLKTFFPHTFTVEETFFAAIIELIKFIFIVIPILFGWKLWKEIFPIAP